MKRINWLASLALICLCLVSCSKDDAEEQKQLVSVTIERITVTSWALTKPDGNPWDALGGLPDLALALRQDGNTIFTTSTAENVSLGSDITYNIGLKITDLDDVYTVAIWDVDLSDNDHMKDISFTFNAEANQDDEILTFTRDEYSIELRVTTEWR